MRVPVRKSARLRVQGDGFDVYVVCVDPITLSRNKFKVTLTDGVLPDGRDEYCCDGWEKAMEYAMGVAEFIELHTD